MEKAESLFENDVPESESSPESTDLASALALAADAPAPLPWGERLEILARAAAALDAETSALWPCIGSRLGPRTASFELGGVEAAFAEACEGFEFRVPHDDPGFSVCAPDWREFLCAGFVRIATELACGRPVLLCTDERFPELALTLRSALIAAGVPEAALVPLHGGRRELVRTLLLDERVQAVSASGSAQRMGELRHLCESHSVRTQRLSTVRCSAYVVEAQEDIEEAARSVALRAFGAGTFGGQLPGQVARAFIPQKVYSVFVESLLECMGTIDELRELVPHIDRDAARRTQRAWIQGLDEGATMISGGEEEMTADNLRLPPTVFCNVELHMRAARRQEPLPVLCLLRSS